jgi:hypothetical protein
MTNEQFKSRSLPSKSCKGCSMCKANALAVQSGAPPFCRIGDGFGAHQA